MDRNSVNHLVFFHNASCQNPLPSFDSSPIIIDRPYCLDKWFVEGHGRRVVVTKDQRSVAAEGKMTVAFLAVTMTPLICLLCYPEGPGLRIASGLMQTDSRGGQKALVLFVRSHSYPPSTLPPSQPFHHGVLDGWRASCSTWSEPNKSRALSRRAPRIRTPKPLPFSFILARYLSNPSIYLLAGCPCCERRTALTTTQRFGSTGESVCSLIAPSPSYPYQSIDI